MAGKGVVFSVIVAVIGILCVAGGLTMVFVMPGVIHNGVIQGVQLKSGSEALDNWKDPPVPVYMQFYLFNLTNKEEMLKNTSVKPRLQQLGPYTYREIRPKLNLTFTDCGQKLSYIQPKSYVFEKDMSVGRESDTLTTVNFGILTIATMLENQPEFIKYITHKVLSWFEDRLFLKLTVDQYVWGYTEPALSALIAACKFFGEMEHCPVDDAKIGLFYKPNGNGSNDGEYNIFTGVGDYMKLNTIYSWNGNTSLPYWGDNYANMINGTDGSMWHPYVSKNESLMIYSSDICRSAYIEYQKEVSAHGIPLYRFVIPKSVLENATLNPANKPFCNGHCLDSGVLNISVCKQGAPLMMSLPHFYHGAQQYIDAFDGLHPKQELHETVIDVDPVTGAALNAAKRLQINFYIKQTEVISDSKRFPDGIIWPVLWVNEAGRINDAGADKYNDSVVKPQQIAKGVQWGLIAVGSLLIVIVLALIVYKAVKNKRGGGEYLAPILPQEDVHT